MGKKILALGLLLSLSFGSFLQVISTGDQAEEVFTLLKASTHHQENTYQPTGLNEDAKVFKNPLFRSGHTLPELSCFNFEQDSVSAASSADFNEFGKERLLSFLYPAHTFL